MGRAARMNKRLGTALVNASLEQEAAAFVDVLEAALDVLGDGGVQRVMGSEREAEEGL
jgi:hypothetical protein